MNILIFNYLQSVFTSCPKLLVVAPLGDGRGWDICHKNIFDSLQNNL
jgi:hypothetical protein